MGQSLPKPVMSVVLERDVPGTTSGARNFGKSEGLCLLFFFGGVGKNIKSSRRMYQKSDVVIFEYVSQIFGRLLVVSLFGKEAEASELFYKYTCFLAFCSYVFQMPLRVVFCLTLDLPLL